MDIDSISDELLNLKRKQQKLDFYFALNFLLFPLWFMIIGLAYMHLGIIGIILVVIGFVKFTVVPLYQLNKVDSRINHLLYLL